MFSTVFWAFTAQADVVISEVYTETPSGQSAYDEFVEICNTGSAAQDVAGWSITDGDHLDNLVAWTAHASALTDGWSGGMVLDSTLLPAGHCAVILDPNYLEGTTPHDIENGTVLLTVEGTAIGEGLGPDDPITLFQGSGTTNADAVSTYGSPIASDIPDERDDDQADGIPIQAQTNRAVYRVALQDADTEGNWLTAAPSPGYRRTQGFFEVSSDGSTDYPNLSSALRVAQSGSEILIHEGLYFDDPEITEAVVIIGVENNDGAVLDGDLQITAVNGEVSLSHLTFTGELLIEDTTVHLEDNLFLQATSIWRYSDGVFANNIVNGANTGLDLQYYSSPEVFGNQFVDTLETALSCFFGSEPLVQGNEFRSAQGTAIDCTAGPLIEDNIIEGFDIAIALSSSSAVVTHNEITDTANAAIEVSYSSDPWVVLNVLKGAGTGLTTSNSGMVFSGNLVFEGLGDGVVIDGGWTPDFFGTIEEEVKVVGNTIVQNAGTGVVVGGATISGDAPEPLLWNNVVHQNGGEGFRTDSGTPQSSANLAFDNAGGNWIGFGPAETDLEADPVFSNDSQSVFLPGFDSPLIDAANTTDLSMDTDLRGVARPTDGDGDGTALSDIGAFEACIDVDRDGYSPSSCLEADLVDCDDNDSSVNPSAEEIWYDGIDQNCDGNDRDQDADGTPLSSDCDDTDPDIQTGCEDTGLGGEPKEPADCGCSSTSATLGPSWLLILGLGLIRRRRTQQH